LLKPEAMIFGIALFYYVVQRVRWEQLMSSCSPLPCYPGDHTYRINEPFTLLFASCALLPGKWWGHVLALLVSWNVLYGYTYKAMLGCSATHDYPLLSSGTLNCWWQISVLEASHISIYLGLGTVIFLCATILLARKLFREIQGVSQSGSIGL
jgi:hypothetical protein